MKIRTLTILLTCSGLLSGGTLVVSSLPDESHVLAPLTSRSGQPLDAGVEIRLGAFPGMTGDDLLDLAAADGFAGINDAFVPFGPSASMGEGADATAGRFEIAVRETLRPGSSPLIDEEIAMLVVKNGGDEFMIARFPGEVFAADGDEAMESFTALHLANARVVVGNRFGSSQMTTAPPPPVGSFTEWIAGFPSITDPALMTPDADADGDGRSNFLEYATGGNPASGADAALSRLMAGEEGGWWFHFRSVPGLGAARYQAQTAEDLAGPWVPLAGSATPAESMEPGAATGWMKVPAPMEHTEDARRFFRLEVSRD